MDKKELKEIKLEVLKQYKWKEIWPKLKIILINISFSVSIIFLYFIVKSLFFKDNSSKIVKVISDKLEDKIKKKNTEIKLVDNEINKIKKEKKNIIKHINNADDIELNSIISELGL